MEEKQLASNLALDLRRWSFDEPAAYKKALYLVRVRRPRMLIASMACAANDQLQENNAALWSCRGCAQG